MVKQEKLTLTSKGHHDIHDLTDKISAIVEQSGVPTGMAHVFNVGSTAAIGTIEFEPGLAAISGRGFSGVS